MVNGETTHSHPHPSSFFPQTDTRHTRLLFLLGWGLVCLAAWSAGGCAAYRGPVDGAERVRVRRDLPYEPTPTSDAYRHSLDIYLPAEGGDWPVVVMFHGGAWMINHKGISANVGLALADHGYVVVCANYRLFPHVRYPEMVRDAARAVAWTKNNIAAYGGDPQRLFVMGHSAGAYLTAALATDPRYLAEFGVDAASLKGAIPVSGVYEVENIDWPWRIIFTNHRQVWREASPLRQARPEAPPFLVLYAEHDLQVIISAAAESQTFAERLRSAGVSVRLVMIPGCGHDGIIEQVGRGDSLTEKTLLDFLKEQR